MEKIPKQNDSNLVKIVLFGPESTGKTTLSRELAKYYNTQFVEEFARDYLQRKWDIYKKKCEEKDILPISIGQMSLENKLAEKANKILICDTDLLETKVYSEQYYGNNVDPKLQKAIRECKYDMYFLTYIDTPWTPDDLRDRPNHRVEMFKAFENTLIKNNRPYVLLKGNKKKRFKKAISIIDELIYKKQKK